MEEKVAEFIGWHLGDGCISESHNKRLNYSLTGDLTEEKEFYEETILPTFNSLFKGITKKEIVLKDYSSVGVCGIYLYNQALIKDVQREYNLPIGKKKNIHIPKEIMQSDNKDIKKAFLRGLFDTDGSIYFCKSYHPTKKPSLYRFFHYKPKIKLATISKKLIEETKSLLVSLDIHSRIQKPIRQRKKENVIHSLVIERMEDVDKWIKEIGFKNPKHQTKVLIWKIFGFCPPNTKVFERKQVIYGEKSIFDFYTQNNHNSRQLISSVFMRHLSEEQANLVC